MTLSDPVLLATLGGIGTGFVMLIRWLKEDRDYWRDLAVRMMDSTEVSAEVTEKATKGTLVEQLSPKAAEAAQRIVRRTRRGG